MVREEMAEYTGEKREQYLLVPNGSICGCEKNGISLKGETEEMSKYTSEWRENNIFPCLMNLQRHGKNGTSLKGVWHDVKLRILCIIIIIMSIMVLSLLISVIVLSVRSGPSNQFETNPQIAGANYTVIQVDSCPNGWIGFQRRCYYFADVERNWTSSWAECASFNASLAVIDSQEEMDFIRRYKGLADHWIGLQRNLETDPWKWIDGTEFSNWFEVRGGGECGYMNDKHIASSSCRREERWVCSKPLESRLQASDMDHLSS